MPKLRIEFDCFMQLVSSAFLGRFIQQKVDLLREVSGFVSVCVQHIWRQRRESAAELLR